VSLSKISAKLLQIIVSDVRGVCLSVSLCLSVTRLISASLCKTTEQIKMLFGVKTQIYLQIPEKRTVLKRRVVQADLGWRKMAQILAVFDPLQNVWGMSVRHLNGT